jgi:hypothetical protein
MQRWGFILAVPDLEAPLPLRTREKPRLDLVLLPTKAGHLTQQICQPLIASIESRWQSRFGNTAIVSLRQSLSEIVVQLDPQLPDCMPILGYGLTASTLPGKILESVVSNPTEVDKLPLPSMLARVLNAFATEFETESQVSLAICANVLRVADQPALLRDLPRISGASKEAIAVAWGYLCRHGFATGESSSGSRSKALVLTPKGLAARRSWVELIPAIESRWRVRFGIAVEKLHQSLSQLVAESPEELLPLVRGIEPGPENWRGKLPKPETLPHFPLVLHRGGFPDGS